MYKIIGADQKEYGPITADQLRQWISEGRINAHTRVQTEGAVGWKSVSELPEFAAVLPVAVPPSLTTPMPVAMAPVAAKSNQMAVWAMVTGILSLLCCQILGPVSIVLGMVALSQIKNNPQQQGSGFAIAGIVLGILSLIVAIICIIMFFSFPGAFPNFQNSFPH
jgi:Domain of unknown function (DUF4190)/GYF domain 2